MVKLIVSTVERVRNHPDADRLTIVKVTGIEHEVVANRHEDGSARWVEGEPVVYVPENTILPLDVVKERGYWDDVKNKGLLGGSKGNRVKMQRFAGFESRGLLFKVMTTLEAIGPNPDGSGDFENEYVVTKSSNQNTGLEASEHTRAVQIGDDVADFFGATEYVPE